MSPSYEEMKSSLNLKSKSGIHRLISALEERGFIKRLAHKARALEVVKLPETASANDIYNSFIQNHPFINVNADNLEIVLRSLLNDCERIMDKGKEGKVWVKNNHDIKSVADKLYNYYARIGLLL